MGEGKDLFEQDNNTEGTPRCRVSRRPERRTKRKEEIPFRHLRLQLLKDD